mgnify:FL=1
MKSTIKYISLLFLTLTFIISCDCDCQDITDTSGPISTDRFVASPGSPTLISPANGKNCEIGSPVDVSTSQVAFSWSASPETDSYNLTYTNLITNSIKTKTGITTNTTKILLFKGIPYAWSVQSINSNSNRASSGTSKFYLKGNPKLTKVPLAAVLKAPSTTGGKTTLTWTGSDPDVGDALTYTLYVDKVDGKQSPVSSGLSSASAELTLDSGTTYYWRVKSTDQTNNSSFSLVSTFNL